MNGKRFIFHMGISRFLIGIVTFINLQAAMYFLFRPADFAPAFELTGEAGRSMIQGMGLLFVMWNVPYLVALVNPLKHNISLIEAIFMQAIGVVGESILLYLLKGEHSLIEASVKRFILFDGAGLILLLLALWFTYIEKRRRKLELVKEVLNQRVD